MKAFCKKFWPLLCFLCALLVALVVFWARSFFPGPADAVKGYLKASLRYDVDGMLLYGSDYQLVSLAGNGDIPKETLRKNLKDYYEKNGFVGKTGKVTFGEAVVTEFDPSGSTYKNYLGEYAAKADPASVSGIARVTVKAFIDGIFQKEYSVIAVKCGARWYYGFVHFE